MANGIRTGDPRGFYKCPSPKSRLSSRVRQTPEETGGHISRNVIEKKPNKNEDNSPKNLKTKILKRYPCFVCLCFL